MRWVVFVAALCVLQHVAAYSDPRRIPALRRRHFAAHPKAYGSPNREDEQVKRCTQHWRSCTLDHFSWRYFVCDEYWKNTTIEKGPILLYLGNEASVEKYIEATGLMWELAPEFGAMLVFIEHRYYGQSKPFGEDFMSNLGYLSVEQAIADYVEFLYEFQAELGGHNLPVIGFGGSYGGMIGAWMRMKYPHVLHGVIASSAPIWSFMGEVPPVDENYFNKIKTYDASPEAGSAAECVPNIRKTWDTLFAIARDPDQGMPAIKKALQFCPRVRLWPSDTWSIIYWIDHAISIMAEGMYNFPSDYMTEGVAKMPPYPLRLGCSYLAEPLTGIELVEAVGKMVGIYYNVTQDLKCFQLETEVSEEGAEISILWDHQYCTEMFQIFGSDGVEDMFWYDPWDPVGTQNYCKYGRGLDTRPYWATQQWGGKDISTATNIIFSNGEYDPWRGGGIQKNVSDSVIALIVQESGHHADLMFSNELDNDSLKAVRKFERDSIAKWIEEVREKNRKLAEETCPPSETPATAAGELLPEPPAAAPESDASMGTPDPGTAPALTKQEVELSNPPSDATDELATTANGREYRDRLLGDSSPDRPAPKQTVRAIV